MCETGGRRRGGEDNSCVCQLIMSAGGVKTAGEGEQNAPFMQNRGREGGRGVLQGFSYSGLKFNLELN